jgi:5-formyltetrahydrofolate cyclo-ligase
VSKDELRKRTLQSRRALPRSQVVEMSEKVSSNVMSLREFKEAKRIASYVATEDEVETAPLIEQAISLGKEVFVPAVDATSYDLKFIQIQSLGDLSPGRFGILEPKDSSGARVKLGETDLTLVPLVAWDDRGHRIGYGKGFFDRALAERASSVAIGLAFESQLVSRVPEGPEDVRLDIVVTEKRITRFDRADNRQVKN